MISSGFDELPAGNNLDFSNLLHSLSPYLRVCSNRNVESILDEDDS